MKQVRLTSGLACSWHGPVPAQDLFAALKAKLESGGPLVTSVHGKLRTAWKDIPGKKAGVLWWQREWKARVAYSVAIEPDYGNPASASEFTMAPVVQERPNDNYPWASASPEQAKGMGKLCSALIQAADEQASEGGSS